MQGWADYNRSMAGFLARFRQKNKKVPSESEDKKLPGIGTIIEGRYRLDTELGRGGMGIVYRAHDILDDHDVAIKTIDINTSNELTLQQFKREAQITARLQHPHIVHVYQTGSLENGMPFIVMEFLQGNRLSETMELTYARIVDIGKQVCDALCYIHEQGFLYRDLKPSNIIVEKAGFRSVAKLIDFGLARPAEEAYLPNESTRAGTVFYLAPELIAGQHAGVAADLYALGATLYEMVTGRVPFSNIDEQTILSQHLQDQVSPPGDSRADVPPELEAIILRLLEKQPQNRFASAREVQDALEKVVIHRAASRGNLPHTNYPGHVTELEQITHLLESTPLVTLLDTSERLALAAGAWLADQFADGVWVVDVSAVDEPIMLLPTMASALGVRGDGRRPLTVVLLEHLREEQCLLILTHCEHLLAACAQLVEIVLSDCPDVYVLAASHQPLHLPVEKCYESAVQSNR